MQIRKIKLSKLGLIFIILQTILTLSIPILVNLYKPKCEFMCIFSDETAYFLFINYPGLFAELVFDNFLESIKPTEVKLQGKIYITDYIFLFLSTSIIYYFLGYLIEIGYKKIIRK